MQEIGGCRYPKPDEGPVLGKNEKTLPMYPIEGQQRYSFFFCKKADAYKKQYEHSVIEGEYPAYPVTVKTREITRPAEPLQKPAGDKIAG
jgi:hypothetical protein